MSLFAGTGITRIDYISRQLDNNFWLPVASDKTEDKTEDKSFKYKTDVIELKQLIEEAMATEMDYIILHKGYSNEIKADMDYALEMLKYKITGINRSKYVFEGM